MNFFKKLFGFKESKPVENTVAKEYVQEKPYYMNYKEATETLINKYGFKYTGKGDNAEECFYKEGARPERVFIHPMHCSFSMDSHSGVYGWQNRPHQVSFNSNYRSESSQKEALLKLFDYLDKHCFIPAECQTKS